MRVSLSLLVLLGVAAVPASSWAEKVTTNQPTKLLARPGEAAKVLIEVKPGKAMTVLAREGRWLKVRVAGRTGYVPRSKVDGEDDDIPRNTRRRAFVDGRSTRRGPGGSEAPDDRVGADALGEGGADTDEGGEDGADSGRKVQKTRKPHQDEDAGAEDGEVIEDGEEMAGGEADPGDDRKSGHVSEKTKVYNEASSKSGVAFTAKTSMVLFPNESKGKYTFVENEEGDSGYLLSSALEIDGGSDDGDDEDGPRGGRQIDLRARVGVSFLTQGIRAPTTGVGFPNNYNISTAAARLAVGGALMYPYKQQYVLGIDGGLDIARSAPGVSFMNQTTALTFYNFVVRGMAGYDLKKKSGAIVFARLGISYQSQQVSNVGNLTMNTAKIPSEIVTAPIIGAALALPALTPKIGLRFSVDAIVAGASVKQTKGLEDGASPAVKTAIVGAGMTYRWKPAVTIQATYDLSYSKYSFGAQVDGSNRVHGTAPSSTRSDVMHTVTVGIAKAF